MKRCNNIKHTCLCSLLLKIMIHIDLRAEWRKWFNESDEAKKAAQKQVLMEEQMPRFFKKFNSLKEENGGDWLVGKNVSYLKQIRLCFKTSD